MDAQPMALVRPAIDQTSSLRPKNKKESAFNAQNSYKFNEIDIGRCVSERPANVATLSSFFFWCLCGLIGVRCTREERRRRQQEIERDVRRCARAYKINEMIIG